MGFTASDVNIDRVLQQIDVLAQVGRQPSGGVTRLTFSPAHREATQIAAGWMAAAGLQVAVDRWGNLLGRSGPGPMVLSGSHLDSVPKGGNYDGVLGVLSALEAVRMLKKNGAAHQALGVISFIEEEGARFHGLLGSKLATGLMTAEESHSIRDSDGQYFSEALAEIEWPYALLEEVIPQDVTAFLELHIEQGRRLESSGIPIGIVTSIAGPTFMRVTLTGQADHAGATAYPDRRDSLLAAAEAIIGIRALALERFAGRGHMTVGRIQVEPNVTNVIAGQTVFDVDYRAADDAAMAAMTESLEKLIGSICSLHHIQWRREILHRSPPVMIDEEIRRAIEQGSEVASVAHQNLVSWAAHDAMNMASVVKSGMLFVLCREGRSHTPEEHVSPEHIADGIAVLANALAALAGQQTA